MNTTYQTIPPMSKRAGSTPSARSNPVVGQQRLEALMEAERVLDVMYTFYRHRGPWETMHGTDVLAKVRRSIALSEDTPTAERKETIARGCE
jgi:hypothetical protein